MSVYNGPQTVTSGLIAAIDASNIKSMMGTGLERIQSTYPSFNNWNSLVGTSGSYVSKTGKTGVTLTITNSNGGGVNWWNSNHSVTACTASVPYIVTARVRWQTNTPNLNLFYIRQYNSSGSQISEYGIFSSSNIVDLGDGFYFTWAYFTTGSTAASFTVQGYDYSNISIWLEDVQCKRAGLEDLVAGTYPAPMFGTMTWSPNNGGKLSYSAGNNLQITNLNLASSSYTVVSAARYNGGTRGRIVNGINNNWLIGHWGTTTENYYAEGWVSGVAAGASDTTWRIHAATWNTGTDSASLYVNGNLVAGPNASASAGPNGIGVGTNGEYSDAEFSFVYAYNRVLTDAEIQTIFYAERARFGI